MQNDGGDIALLDHPVIRPVELAEELWNAGIDAFKAAMLGRMTSKDVERYWENCSDQDWFNRHPHRPEHWNSTLPVWVHGDAARAFKRQKISLHVAGARRFACNVVDEFGIRSGHQLHSIASLGAGGKYENNAEKEFHLMLQGVFWAVRIL